MARSNLLLQFCVWAHRGWSLRSGASAARRAVGATGEADHSPVWSRAESCPVDGLSQFASIAERAGRVKLSDDQQAKIKEAIEKAQAA